MRILYVVTNLRKELIVMKKIFLISLIVMALGTAAAVEETPTLNLAEELMTPTIEIIA
ncbi:hypothetical protein NO1_0629 [Candidatus Termititenax aidoneus]|uniref:Uncharacterized protein n=1 Tax=Termititenax aidoneus TaxID=2218524 RepID=A0A388T9J2_TERA1|nr:hypothetical protein NO1_0629 [Candidatus Termititenax aidoneus]